MTKNDEDNLTRRVTSGDLRPLSAAASDTDGFRRRDINLLRETVAMLAHFIWFRSTRPGDHMWSIPVDQERDWDCILTDAIDELEHLRGEGKASDARLTDSETGKATGSAEKSSSSVVTPPVATQEPAQ